MQESTIKFNLAYMRLLCGLLLFSIIDYCLFRSFYRRGHLVFCHGFNYYFSTLSKLIPTKLTDFHLIFHDFFLINHSCLFFVHYKNFVPKQNSLGK